MVGEEEEEFKREVDVFDGVGGEEEGEEEGLKWLEFWVDGEEKEV